ncbi:MAG TPA: zinc ribbon domain-containing protein [Terriglobia bacterium]|nr:zinc ribbon domain-containing protein [Terriglobia bacterium]
MFCSNCGANLVPGQNFCSKCGTQVGAAGPAPPEPPVQTATAPVASYQSRIEKHTRVLGILWLVVSLLRLVPAFGLWFGSGIATHFIPFPFHAFVWPIAGFIGTLLFATSIAGFLAGWGLLNYRSWARVLALVLGIIALIHFPFGTALGIYTLWVLLPRESEREYRRLARTA